MIQAYRLLAARMADEDGPFPSASPRRATADGRVKSAVGIGACSRMGSATPCASPHRGSGRRDPCGACARGGLPAPTADPSPGRRSHLLRSWSRVTRTATPAAAASELHRRGALGGGRSAQGRGRPESPRGGRPSSDRPARCAGGRGGGHSAREPPGSRTGRDRLTTRPRGVRGAHRCAGDGGDRAAARGRTRTGASGRFHCAGDPGRRARGATELGGRRRSPSRRRDGSRRLALTAGQSCGRSRCAAPKRCALPWRRRSASPGSPRPRGSARSWRCALPVRCLSWGPTACWRRASSRRGCACRSS